MDFFPAFLNLNDKPVLVVGGGTVAARKIKMLIAAGARPHVVAPQVVPAIGRMLRAGQLSHSPRRFRDDDVTGHWLVVSACGAPGLSKKVARAAQRARVFCNAVDEPGSCSYIVPAIVDRSPILVAVSSGGTAPVLARQIRARIEALLPAGIGNIARLAGRWRQRVADELQGGEQKRRFWERLFAGRLQDSLDTGGAIAVNNEIAVALADAHQAGTSPGVALLVGAGPGDPELLTLKALQALQTADVILYDRLVSSEVLAMARRDAELVSVGKTPGSAANGQQEINAMLVSRVAAGERVCRLKGGDPFIFGRGGEEAAALAAAGLACKVIPGITAAAACAAAAGIPLTHRDVAQSLTFLTGHGTEADSRIDWAALARGRQTLAIYMGVQRASELMNNLTAHGRAVDTPIAIIERGSTPQQRVLRGTLGQLPLLIEAERVAAPAMLIVGEVARFGQKAAAEETRAGRRAGLRRGSSDSAIKLPAASLASS
ncbi:MAG TPA: siroheme synthase CysG [Woeseiaceae bacterium]|nr:siroheme synthase CysG [Woeseiaceae bacterium]